MKIKKVVINLDRAPERLIRFKNSFIEHNLPYDIERFQAVDKLDKERMDKLKSIYNAEIGRVTACALSHIEVIREFLDSDDDVIYIFEDDAIITNKQIFDMEHILTSMKIQYIDFDMIYLNARIQKHPKDFGANAGCGLEGYIVSKHGAKKLMSISQNMKHPIDLYYQAHCTHFKKRGFMKDCINKNDVIIKAFKPSHSYVKEVDMKKSYNSSSN